MKEFTQEDHRCHACISLYFPPLFYFLFPPLLAVSICHVGHGFLPSLHQLGLGLSISIYPHRLAVPNSSVYTILSLQDKRPKLSALTPALRFILYTVPVLHLCFSHA